MWGSLAMLGSQIIGGTIAAGTANVNALNQNTTQLQDQQMQFADNSANNKTIAETNLHNQIRTSYRLGILNVQRGQAKKVAAQSGIDLGKRKLSALGAVNANSAAAGSIGSSVDAVVSDIEQQAEHASAAQTEDSRVTDMNFDQSFMDTINAGRDSLMSAQQVNTRSIGKAQQVGQAEVITNALVNTGAQYASSMMKLGLGS